MVSNFPYRSFKDVDLKRSLPFMYLVLGVAILAFVAIRPELTLFFLFVSYAFLGLIVGSYKKFFRKKKTSNA
jgi:CDP-diacylglycerol--serine O-phosphatidyltransferase